MSVEQWDDRSLVNALDVSDLATASRIALQARDQDIASLLGRHPTAQQAVVFRLLPKDRALRVFEMLGSAAQAELVSRLREDEVAAVFDEMDPDDRASLLEELPATVTTRLMRGLSAQERELTATVLGYPDRSVGRRMSPEVVAVRTGTDAATALGRVRDRAADAETIYTLPLVDDHRRVVGVVGLRDLLTAAPGTRVDELARPADLAEAAEPAEAAARRCAGAKRLALPVVDSEQRLVGVLTVDDALTVLEAADSEDQARQGGSEPLRRPYLSIRISSIVRARVVWLLVLAIGATLTVQVLENFEATLSEMVVLSVFIPLLIGTGGNTGNQAATTVTRALALGEVRPADVLRIMGRELLVGTCLGLVLGTLGFVVVTIGYGPQIGEVIGLTLLAVCALAATAGGAIPLIARVLRADPAVFSNPFISTLLDATGLIIYFLIAKALLGI